MRRVRITNKHIYILLWLLGLALAVVYAAAIVIERTAPLNPITHFHVSVAGSVLFFAYPVAVTLQIMLVLTGISLLVIGMIGPRKWVWAGFGILGLGLLFAALNYVVSI
jgi:hypothetical protein